MGFASVLELKWAQVLGTHHRLCAYIKESLLQTFTALSRKRSLSEKFRSETLPLRSHTMHLPPTLVSCLIATILVLSAFAQETTTVEHGSGVDQGKLNLKEGLEVLRPACREAVEEKCKKPGKNICQSLTLKSGKKCSGALDEGGACSEAEYYGIRAVACKEQCSCGIDAAKSDKWKKVFGEVSDTCKRGVEDPCKTKENFCQSLAQRTGLACTSSAGCTRDEYFTLRPVACDVECECSGVVRWVSSTLVLGLCIMVQLMGKL